MEFGDLPLRFAEGRRARKGLCNRLAMHLAQDTNLRCVPGIVGLGTMTVGLTTAMHDGRNGTGAQITQTQELLQDLDSLGFQRIQGI